MHVMVVLYDRCVTGNVDIIGELNKPFHSRKTHVHVRTIVIKWEASLVWRLSLEDLLSSPGAHEVTCGARDHCTTLLSRARLHENIKFCSCILCVCNLYVI